MDLICWSDAASAARIAGRPILAVETMALRAGIAPAARPAFAGSMAELAARQGAEIAWLAMVGGRARIGLDPGELDRFLALETVRKVASRDLGATSSAECDGALTVSASLAVMRAAGLDMLVTGGIGGVPREAGDISADIAAIGSGAGMIVCAGIKPFLDIGATLAALDALEVPIWGLGCDAVPVLYAAGNHPVDRRFDDVRAISRAAAAQGELGGKPPIVVVAVPPEHAIGRDRLDRWIDSALEDCARRGIAGSAVTPALVDHLDTISAGAVRKANAAALATAIEAAVAIASDGKR
ncbi:MAG TPA: pseudouridine-5'-phosphate glycosidase [Sphingopyxis sp.]|nr:pseudouridine-5'-phosphate glycosidase [Sphingopyxis sp.]